MQNISRVEVKAVKREWADGISILMREKIPQGWAYAQPITMQYQEEPLIVEPTLTITYSAAQALMDDLWQAGLRPSEGSGSAGSLKATQEHLADMRKLVFDDCS